MNKFPDASIASFVNCPLMDRPAGDGYKGIIHLNKEKEADPGKLVIYKPLAQDSEGQLIPIADEPAAIAEMSSICKTCEYKNLHNTKIEMRDVFVLRVGEMVRTCAALIKNS